MMTNKPLAVLGMMAVFAGCAAASPVTPALSFTPSDFVSAPYSVGWEFYVNQSVTIQGLLFYDYCGANTDPANCPSSTAAQSDVLQASHDVGIYALGGSVPLVSDTVLPSDLLVGGVWQGHDLAGSPVTLGAGYYSIMGTVSGDAAAIADQATITTVPRIQFVTDVANLGSGVLSPPADGSAGLVGSLAPGWTGWFGPSFYVAAADAGCSVDDGVSHDDECESEDTPEPATFGLAGCCLAGIVALRRILA